MGSVPPAVLRIREECFLHCDCAVLSNVTLEIVFVCYMVIFNYFGFLGCLKVTLYLGELYVSQIGHLRIFFKELKMPKVKNILMYVCYFLGCISGIHMLLIG